MRGHGCVVGVEVCDPGEESSEKLTANPAPCLLQQLESLPRFGPFGKELYWSIKPTTRVGKKGLHSVEAVFEVPIS